MAYPVGGGRACGLQGPKQGRAHLGEGREVPRGQWQEPARTTMWSVGY